PKNAPCSKPAASPSPQGPGDTSARSPPSPASCSPSSTCARSEPKPDGAAPPADVADLRAPSEQGRQSRPEPTDGCRTISTTRSSLDTGSPPSLFTVPAMATSSEACASAPSLP